ncbi:MAG TPA: UvrD-helicase domain-containing protein, partial [Mycobacterium sp.]|nr:UvrD-helicase domain-containing protein [Mycobacterium sp.]
AGTGKTYAIVGLAARYIAEDITDLDHLMLVTFSRAATQELRERARDRFRRCAEALADPPTARASSDEVIAHLADGTDAEVAARWARLRQALSNFDAATIVTTHAFCERMLDGIGVTGDYQPEAGLLENTTALLTEVVDDVYAAQYCPDAAPALERSVAARIATAATDIPFVALAPAGADPDSPAAQRVRFAAAVRAELSRRKRAAQGVVRCGIALVQQAHPPDSWTARVVDIPEQLFRRGLRAIWFRWPDYGVGRPPRCSLAIAATLSGQPARKQRGSLWPSEISSPFTSA